MNRRSRISLWAMFLILSLLLTVSCAPRRETFEIVNKRARGFGGNPEDDFSASVHNAVKQIKN
jgi:hypothetical protein